jgi:hypothetical protein
VSSASQSFADNGLEETVTDTAASPPSLTASDVDRRDAEDCPQQASVTVNVTANVLENMNNDARDARDAEIHTQSWLRANPPALGPPGDSLDDFVDGSFSSNR